jgi:hypothetical protein
MLIILRVGRQVIPSVFDKKDKASKKIQANFSDFWDKFVMHAPEVTPSPPPLPLNSPAATRLATCLQHNRVFR